MTTTGMSDSMTTNLPKKPIDKQYQMMLKKRVMFHFKSDMKADS